MKTPKREDVDPIDEPVYDEMFGICDITSDFGPRHTAHASWKRKNKIAQLKRTIARLEAENFELECLSTRITYEGTMQEMLTFLPHP